MNNRSNSSSQKINHQKSHSKSSLNSLSKKSSNKIDQHKKDDLKRPNIPATGTIVKKGLA